MGEMRRPLWLLLTVGLGAFREHCSRKDLALTRDVEVISAAFRSRAKSVAEVSGSEVMDLNSLCHFVPPESRDGEYRKVYSIGKN
jgi:hypothetical protein